MKKMEENTMKYLMSAEWWKAAGIRAAKTMFQTGAALIVTQMSGGTVDWMAVGSAVIVAGVASLDTSLAGTGETVKRQKKKEPDASGSFKVLSEDDHRNS